MSNHLPKEVLEHLNNFPDHQTMMLEVADDVRKLQNNFEIHLQNQIRYAEEVIKVSKKVDKLCDDFTELHIRVTPLVDNFTGLNWSGKALLKLLGILAAVGGLALMIKQLLK